MQDQLAAVLTSIDRLRRLDPRSVEPMAHVGEVPNRLDITKGPRVLGEGEGA